MNKNSKLKKIIDSCKLNLLIETLRDQAEINSFELEAGNESEHWFLYLYKKCGKNFTKKFLKSSAVDINSLKNKKGKSLIYQAYSYQEKDLVELLLSHGADSVADKGFTLLHWIASDGDTDLLSKILQVNKNLNLNIKDSINEDEDRTPLHWAAQENKVNMGKMLLRYGANIDAKDLDGKTPLHIAASEGNTEFVKMLLIMGADPGTRDSFDLTPKSYADLYEHTKVSKLLP